MVAGSNGIYNCNNVLADKSQLCISDVMTDKYGGIMTGKGKLKIFLF
jgi:hypothetical protein